MVVWYIHILCDFLVSKNSFFSELYLIHLFTLRMYMPVGIPELDRIIVSDSGILVF